MAYIGVSPSNGVRRVHTYTATASQTTFSGAGAEGTSLSYKDSNFVDVYQNGIKLGDADYTSTSGTSIVLAQGASVDDLVVVVVFDVFSVADTVSKADGGTFDGAVTFGGAVTADAGVSVDNITIDGTEIDLSSGDLTLDVAGDIILDADGGDVNFQDGGTVYGFMAKSSDNLLVGNAISDGDVLVRGNDGGSNITAVTFDMSEAGLAIFNAGVAIGGTGSANTLDDYEEGTWTPTYNGGTAPTVSYNTQDGKYTKIGQTVAFNCRIATNSKSGGSGSLYIAGLPFANSKISAGAVVSHSWLGEHPMKFRVVSSSIFLYYRSSLHDDDILANSQTADMNTSGSGANLIEVTGVYFTDS